ncbi:MAG: glycosyltransferase [Betaproteobacteria bacterium]|nr:glycosyltransferase [Betaproteobacteria bacterium]
MAGYRHALEVMDNDLALGLLERAAEARPGDFALQTNLSALKKAAGDLHGALRCAAAAIALAPERAEPRYNLGLLKHELGEHAEAEKLFRQAIGLAPAFEPAHDSLICLLDQMHGVDAQAMLAQRRQWADRYANLGSGAAHSNNNDAERVLKIGYVSADFRGHSSAYFLEPLFAQHDASRYRVHCYYNWPHEDAVTQRLKRLAPFWRDIHALDDERAAAAIRADGIDVLVDLSGHTVGHRLGVFARRPAPVQATYLGYLGSTGLPAVRYRISDARLDPPGLTESTQTETIVRMPRCCICFAPERGAPPPNRLPALENGALTFGSFNARTKVNEAVLDLWARLLAEIPGSRLIMVVDYGGDETVAKSLRDRFARAGVDPQRIDVRGRQRLAAFFSLFHEIDVALDPFPYNGGTTTYHSLWMGVPVITLAGRWALARCGLMILENAGIPEFVARSEAQYLGIAQRCAADLPRLAALRGELRSRFLAAPFADAAGAARALEAAYRSMWQEWCKR